MTDVDTDRVAARVLAWGGPRLRDLPWRRSRDPWEILVAEVMCQQTQVDRVVPKWHEFLGAFPDAPSCAAAPLGDVLRLWQGLGYPRRARHLHDSAVAITSQGGFPTTLEGLLALPGVGAYTARAVMAFALELDAAVVDTNTARVLARVSGRRLTAREAQSLADALVPAGSAWLWNQSFMDLGAQLCRPVPKCEACPVASMCAWNRQGCVDPDPASGSAGVSQRQARFEGSDRQVRGRIMARLVTGACSEDALRAAVQCDAERLARLVAALVEERLVERRGALLSLPASTLRVSGASEA